MLANKQIIIKAQNSLEIRNFLINQLNSAASGDKNRVYKFIFSFILGSCLKINEACLINPGLNKSYLYSFYNCFLRLEHEASSYEFKQPEITEIIRRCQTSLLVHFNRHYKLILKSPRTLLEYWQSTIQFVPDFAHNAIEFTILEKISELCLNELNMEQIDKAKVSIKDLHVLYKTPRNSYLSRLINAFISQSSKPTLFFPYWGATDYQLEHVFIKNHEGIILEALHVSKKGRTSKTAVLVMWASLRPEEYYLFHNLKNYYELFDTDVVCIKNRNCSRTHQVSSHSREVAQDVETIVNHYHYKKHTNVLLYGMCGGAPHMIVAAENLHRNNTPYKLIVDRFATSYSTFYQIQVVLRFIGLFSQLILNTPDAGKPKKIQALVLLTSIAMPCLLALASIANPLFLLAKETINYGEILRSLPQSNVLVLQGKGRKEKDNKTSLVTDFIISPENSLRKATRELRQKKKERLLSLQHQSSKIYLYFDTNNELRTIFKQLAVFFENCLKIISNEKLTLIENPKYITDIHSKHLFELTTRNKMPINQFVSGFFNPTKIKVNFDVIPSYEKELITKALNLQGNVLNYGDVNTLAADLASFLEQVKLNVDSLCPLANRIYNSGLDDIGQIITKMLQSPLFHSLEEVQRYKYEESHHNLLYTS